MTSARFTEYLVAERQRYRREDTALGLIAFKLAQIIWQNGSGKGQKPEIGRYIPHLAKKPEDAAREMMEMCKMFNAAMGGSDAEGGECADPADLQKLRDKKAARLPKAIAPKPPAPVAGRGYRGGKPGRSRNP